MFLNTKKSRALSLIGRVPDCQLGLSQFESGRARVNFNILFYIITGYRKILPKKHLMLDFYNPNVFHRFNQSI